MGSTTPIVTTDNMDNYDNTGFQLDEQLNKTTDIDVTSPPTTGEMNFHVVFLGFNTSFVNTTYLQQELITWYAPIDRYPQLYATGASPSDTLQYDVNYTINYQFDFRPDTEVQDYITFLHTNAKAGELGFEWPYFYDTTYQSANYIRSDAAEQYLTNKYSDGVNPTLVVIDTYSSFRSTFNPYYYNNSYGELDFPSFLGRRSSSITQIGGGGHDSRLLFVDYSAGPNTYYDYQSRDSFDGVYQYDFTLPANIAAFNQQMEQAIQSAIEFKYLPSYLYSPVVPSPNQKVVFEFLPVNFEKLSTFAGFESVPTSTYNMLDAFDPEVFIQQFREMNPDISWNYRINNAWDWTQDSTFAAQVQAATTIYDTNNGYIDSTPLMSYLDSYYQSLFNSTTSQEYILPVFLWFFPGTYGTDFGGIANSDANGVFNYIIDVVSHDFVVDKQLKTNWVSNYKLNATADSLPNYSYVGYFVSYFPGEIFETSITMNTGTSAVLEVMNMIELRKFMNSQSYTPLHTLSMNSLGTYTSFNVTGAKALTVYAWVLRNTGGSGWANTSLTIDRYYHLKQGFTRVAIHEGGHSIGISHPHDGFSWEIRNDPSTYYSGAYVNWVWDFSDTPMTYSSSVPVFSPMDQDTYRRSVLPDYFALVHKNLTDLLARIDLLHDYIPPDVYGYVAAASANLTQSIAEF